MSGRARSASSWASALAALAIATTVATTTSPAHARPQNSATVQLGAVGLGEDGGLWRSTRFDLGLRFESIFGRSSPRDFGIGTFLEARTAWFSHADYGGGLVMLLPIDDTFPLWLGGGGFGRREDKSFHGGANAFLGWGSRSYNHHSSYGMTYGLVVDARWHAGPEKGVDLVVAATIDLEGIALPFVYLTSALLH